MALVFAEKYELLERKAGTDGEFNKNGSKKLVLGGRMVSEKMVNKFNNTPNNVLYIVDEEKTKELRALRDENLVKNKEKEAYSKVSTADQIQAIAEGIGKIANSSNDEEKPKRKRRTKEEIEKDNQ